jgi:hypothetical protein
VSESEFLLQCELISVSVPCFIQHWQKDEQIGYTNITLFKLLNSFCRVRSEHGGACIYQKKLKKKFGGKINYFEVINEDKKFETAVIELSGKDYHCFCI